MRALSEALRVAWSRPWLVVTAAATNLVIATFALAPLSVVLRPLIDHHAAANDLAWNGRDELAWELITDHPELLSILATGVALALGAHSLLSSILCGGFLSVYPDRAGAHGTRGSRVFLASTGLHAPTMLALSLLGLLLQVVGLVPVLAVWVPGKAALLDRRWNVLFPSLLAMGSLAAVGSATASVIVHRARAAALRGSTPLSALPRVLWCVTLDTIKRPWPALSLAVSWVAAFVVCGLAQHAPGALLSDQSTVLFGLTVLLGLAAAVARASLSIALLLAAAGVATGPRPRSA